MRISVGDIVLMDCKRFRILYLNADDIVLCQMDVSTLQIMILPFKSVLKQIDSGEFSLVADEETTIVNVDQMGEKQKKTYQTRLMIAQEICNAYAPYYTGLTNYGRKEAFERIIEKNNVPRNSAWRYIREYLQSGMKASSLLNKNRKKGPRNYQKKTGKPNIDGINEGCIITEYEIQAFAAALEYYKTGRAKSRKDAYDYMNNMFFKDAIIENGVYTSTLKPIDMRPTLEQMRYYFRKHLTKEENDIIKTSSMEHRNDQRILTGEDADRVEFPGEKVETDTVEFDNSLVSILDREQSIGRPIIYVMRDSLTHAIVAFSIGLENNSRIGLENLLLNLGEDKIEFCKKYGVFIEDSRLWPSNFIPKELYADRGSDYASDEFGRQCSEMGIIRHLWEPKTVSKNWS